MSNPGNTGFGDPSLGGVWPGGYGDHPDGYGHPSSLELDTPTGLVRRDIGGEVTEFAATQSGTLPPGPYQVTVSDVVCYSGVQGQGSDVHPDSKLQKFRFVTPNLYGQLGDHDVKISGAFGTIVFPGALTIVRYAASSFGIGYALRFGRAQPVWYLPIARPRAGES